LNLTLRATYHLQFYFINILKKHVIKMINFTTYKCDYCGHIYPHPIPHNSCLSCYLDKLRVYMPANNKSELILSKWFWAKLAAYHSMIISPFAVIVYYTYGIDNYL